MNGGAERARQPVKAHRRFIPAIGYHTFHVIQQLAAVQNRQRLKAVLQKLLAGSDVQAVPKYAGWLMKLLIVMSLAFSGWVITLVSYLLAVVIYNLLRSQLAEPAAA